MKLQFNVGRQAISIGLLVVMLTWLFFALVAVVAGVEKLPGWLVACAIAIGIGWIASALYREMEIKAVENERRRLQELGAPADYIKETCPFPASPVGTVSLGLFWGEDVSSDQWERKGPPYGWVPMMLAGPLFVLGVLWSLKVPWPAGIVALFLYLFAASVEHPWLARRMKQ